MDFDDYVSNAARHILIYGPPKVGKTALLGKLAEELTLHVFDAEDGIKTLRNPEIMKPEFRKNVKVYPMPDTQAFPVFADTLLKVLVGKEHRICHAHGVADKCPVCDKDPAAKWSTFNVDALGKNDVLVLDNVTQLAASMMHRICAKQLAGPNADSFKPEWEDYRRQGFLLDRIFSILQAAPFNVVCISHEIKVKREDGREVIVPIGGTSNFSATFAKYFDDVVYCDKVNGKHKAFSSSTYSNSIITGSRTGKSIETEARGLLALFD